MSALLSEGWGLTRPLIASDTESFIIPSPEGPAVKFSMETARTTLINRPTSTLRDVGATTTRLTMVVALTGQGATTDIVTEGRIPSHISTEFIRTRVTIKHPRGGMVARGGTVLRGLTTTRVHTTRSIITIVEQADIETDTRNGNENENGTGTIMTTSTPAQIGPATITTETIILKKG